MTLMIYVLLFILVLLVINGSKTKGKRTWTFVPRGTIQYNYLQWLRATGKEDTKETWNEYVDALKK